MNRCANASCPTFSSTRIPQSNQKCRKRGGILEQRRRPIVKFQSDFALSHDIGMRLKRYLEAPLSDRCSEAQTHRLRCGRIVPRTSCPIATAESRFRERKFMVRDADQRGILFWTKSARSFIFSGF